MNQMTQTTEDYKTEYINNVVNLNKYEREIVELVKSELQELPVLFGDAVIQIILDYSKSWKQHFEYKQHKANQTDFNEIFECLPMFKNVAPVSKIISEYLYYSMDDIWKQTAFWKKNGTYDKLYKACDLIHGALEEHIHDSSKNGTCGWGWHRTDTDLITSSNVETEAFELLDKTDPSYVHYSSYVHRPEIPATTIDFIVLRLTLKLDQDINSVFYEIELWIGGQLFQQIVNFYFLSILLRMYGYRIHRTILSDSQILEIPLPFDFILNQNYNGMPRHRFTYHDTSIRLRSQIYFDFKPVLLIRYLYKIKKEIPNMVICHSIFQSDRLFRTLTKHTMIMNLHFNHPVSVIYFFFTDRYDQIIYDNDLITDVYLSISNYMNNIQNGWSHIYDFPGIYSISFANENPVQKFGCGSLNFSRVAEFTMTIKLNSKNPNYHKMYGVNVFALNRNIIRIQENMCGILFSN